MKKGFTLVELLIVVVILMLLMLAVLVGWKNQVNRANDSLRKKHLNDIKRAFEEYYNDNGCYPPQSMLLQNGETGTILEHCDGPELQPYIKAVPCDPHTKTPYNYVPIDDTVPPNICLGYRAFAGLLDVNDTDITAQGCSGITGCGYGSEWNYGISSGGSVALPGFDPGALPTSTPGPQPGQNACTLAGSCDARADPIGPDPENPICPITYATNCTVDDVDQCMTPTNRCRD